ncbi:hypothetical protein EV368DRAFT_67777 [Lentinula lateritia]|uniref:Uncharacterized protein n=1 Tax=Lentinula aff. lateritia TaxID=2804960 RepID=A0ACC1TPJ3_9AGAR|nr:hypothetical protein F5876DRAFT_80568 [Lentinula aff. lateritia]KAJ3849017.1 hypothetical protein EV368DRAFT_67777 [Lentinula lateritia]
MFKLSSAFVISALAFSAARAQDIMGLSWNSTSPYGQSTGVFNLLESTYGYSMVFTDGTSTLSATYDSASQTVTQVCPHAGLIAAMIPVEGSSPSTFTIEWVDSTVILPEGSSTTSLVPGNGAFLTTMGTPNGVFAQNGIFKEFSVDGTYVFAWADETFQENQDVTAWIDISDGSAITC